MRGRDGRTRRGKEVGCGEALVGGIGVYGVLKRFGGGGSLIVKGIHSATKLAACRAVILVDAWGENMTIIFGLYKARLGYQM